MKPTDRQIITRAIELLTGGLLISALPGELQKEFNITGPTAWKMATEAVKEMRDNEQPNHDQQI